MKRTLIQNAILINEGQTQITDVAIVGNRITQIASHIPSVKDDKCIDATGLHLLPGPVSYTHLTLPTILLV